MNNDLLMILKTIKKRTPRKGNKGERGRTMNLKDPASSLNRRKAKKAVAVSTPPATATPKVNLERPAEVPSANEYLELANNIVEPSIESSSILL